MGAGKHTVVITPNVDSKYVRKPKPIEMDLIITEKPYWDFDGQTFPILGNISSGYYSYGGLMAVGGSDFTVSSGSVDLDGSATFGSRYGSYDRRLLRFNVNQHGKFKVKVRNGQSNARTLVFAAVNESNGTISTSRSINSYQTEDIYFDTRDVIDEFKDGKPVDMAVYCEQRLYVESVEFIRDDDQRPGINTSYYSYSLENQRYHNDRYFFIHNYDMYRNTFYLIPGFASYFGFTDNNPRAEKYKIGIYENTSSTEPLWEQEFDANKCKTYDGDINNPTYFVCPFYLPENTLERGRNYVVGIVPVKEGCKEGSPKFLSVWNGGDVYDFVKVDEETPLEWWKYQGTNPFYDDGGFGNYAFFNEEGHIWDYKGLVIHGGRGSMSITEDHISIDGSGYPLVNENQGRYFSFTLGKPGKIVARGSGTGSLRLYKNSETLRTDQNYVSESPMAASFAEFELSTGEVDGPTEFILSPNGRLSIYSIKFVPDE